MSPDTQACHKVILCHAFVGLGCAISHYVEEALDRDSCHAKIQQLADEWEYLPEV